MIALKDYQERVLASLRAFLAQCARDGRAEAAFEAAQLANGTAKPRPYVPVHAPGLSTGMPYVCLRVPTGGGKTLLACHAAGIAQQEFLHSDKSVVLWLVPSTTILDQTVDALRDARHPYHRALEMSCGAVEVLTVQEALQVSRATIDAQTVVIVGTIQSFRVEDTSGRKVYEQNGAFLEHLQNVPSEALADLLPGPDGKPTPSLVNMLRLRRPIVIVDEAHNARTLLSFDTLGFVRPSCIIEFTATPATTTPISNVLHRVSAAELKAAQMVKLPLRVVTRAPHEAVQLLAESVALRKSLETLAKNETAAGGRYLRPILLVQAERVDDCEDVRTRLVKDLGFATDEVKISVGSNDELEGIDDLLAPSCAVRVVITVQKLREGWDCPFAYVLCSLRRTRSATAMEQMVGRVLRQPYARAWNHPDLNCAYALTVSSSIDEVLSELRDALETNGFTRAEAEQVLLTAPSGSLPLALTTRTVQLPPAALDDTAVQRQSEKLKKKVSFDTGSSKVTITTALDADEEESLLSCAATETAKQQLREAAAAVRQAETSWGQVTPAQSPYQQNLPFRVPTLAYEEEGELLLFESTLLMEQPWRLSERDATLPTSYNPLKRPTGKAGLIDVGSQGEVQTTALGESDATDFVAALHHQVTALGAPPDWTLDRLIVWLDKHIDHRDIPVNESAEFLRKVVRGLMAQYGLNTVGELALDRFRLRDQIDTRINEHRKAERAATFKQLMMPGSRLKVVDSFAVDFRTTSYEPSWWHDGAYKFQKHYFARVGEFDEGTEEGACAKFIDRMPEVKYWVRNLSRRPKSFRLQTSSDWFYPDFVCLLTDGRILVVEYKGAHLYTGTDAEEKRLVGKVWADRSEGKCLFWMPTNKNYEELAEVVKT